MKGVERGGWRKWGMVWVEEGENGVSRGKGGKSGRNGGWRKGEKGRIRVGKYWGSLEAFF